MALADIVIAWSFATVPQAVRSAFERPTVFVEIPTPAGRKYSAQLRSFVPSPIRGILKKFAPGVEPLRIAALGFSESCAGVGSLLNGPDGAHVNAAVAIDGIHVAPGKVIPPDALTNWVSFAELAAVGERLCVITHSSVVPPYVSTTQTADYIWERAARTKDRVAIPPARALQASPYTTTVGPPLVQAPYTVSYPDIQELALGPRRANGLVVLGWQNKVEPGYADHRRQAKQILPAVVAAYLADRWNKIDPNAPGEACYAE